MSASASLLASKEALDISAYQSDVDSKINNYFIQDYRHKKQHHSKLQKEIETKTRIVNQALDEGNYYGNINIVLSYTCALFFFYLLIYIGFKKFILGRRSSVYLLIFITLLYLYIMITKYFWLAFVQKMRELGFFGEAVEREILSLIVPKWHGKCPKGCTPKEKRRDPYEIVGNQ